MNVELFDKSESFPYFRRIKFQFEADPNIRIKINFPLLPRLTDYVEREIVKQCLTVLQPYIAPNFYLINLVRLMYSLIIEKNPQESNNGPSFQQDGRGKNRSHTFGGQERFAQGCISQWVFPLSPWIILKFSFITFNFSETEMEFLSNWMSLKKESLKIWQWMACERLYFCHLLADCKNWCRHFISSRLFQFQFCFAYAYKCYGCV